MKNVEKIKPTGLFTNYIYKAIPLAFDESMSYYETLCGLLSYLKDTVIPTVNNNADAIIELQNLMEELQNYVNNYFNNLDVQEEINNKLDVMAQDGTLENLISKYVNNNVKRIFNTVVDMKKSNLLPNIKIQTIGYYSINDGGGADYYISNEEPNDQYYETLDNGNFAILILDNNINIAQFGAKGDGINDDTIYIKNALQHLKYGMTLNFKSNARYKISETLYFPKGANYYGNDCTLVTSSETENYYFIEYGNTTLNNVNQTQPINFLLKDFCFVNAKNLLLNGIHVKNDVNIQNIYSYGLNKTIECYDDYIDFIKISDINIYAKRGDDYAINTGFLGDSREIRRIHYHVSTEVTKSRNVLKIGNGHNCCILDTLINGNINVTGSNVNIRNLHLEVGNITLSECECNIESCYIWKQPSINPIIINANSRVNITNMLISYRDNYDYSNDECIDISINNKNCILSVKNCYKIMQSNKSVTFKVLGGIKTNNNSFNENITNNSINSILRNSFINTSMKTLPLLNQYGILSSSTFTDSNNTWKIDSNTYYYNAICLYDEERLIGLQSGNGANKSLVKDGSSIILTLNDLAMSKLRLYRGLSANNFDHYVDTSAINTQIVDNGIICNGNKWKDRISGTMDTILNATSYEHINLRNVKVYANSLPTVGSWKKGDIIINYNAQSNGIYGWECIEDGTPGTWQKISTLN